MRIGKSALFRIIFDSVLVAMVFFLPWWVAILVALAGLFFFNNYLEMLFFGFLYDALFSPTVGIERFLYTVLGFTALIISIIVKEYIRV